MALSKEDKKQIRKIINDELSNHLIQFQNERMNLVAAYRNELKNMDSDFRDTLQLYIPFLKGYVKRFFHESDPVVKDLQEILQLRKLAKRKIDFDDIEENGVLY